jgi:hypothetical protein
MILMHGLLDPAWAWALILMALLSVSLIAILGWGLLNAYGKRGDSSSEGLKNAGERHGPNSKVE